MTITDQVSTLVQQSTALNERVEHAIAYALDEKRLVGGVVIVSQHGKTLVHHAFGHADRETETPFANDTLFRFASVTKPFVAVAALRLVEQGTIGIDDPVTHWLPDFTPALPGQAPATIRIRHLLTHTSGLSYRLNEPADSAYATADISDGLDHPGRSLEDNLARIALVPLLSEPGSAWHYSVGLDVLGAILQQATGRPLADVVDDLVLAPLGLVHTSFSVASSTVLATPYVSDTPEPHRMGDLETVPLWPGSAGVRFEPSRAFDSSSFPSGGAGMIGSVSDVHALLEAIRQDATDGEARLLSQATAQSLFEGQIGDLETDPGKTFSFAGAVVANPAIAGTPQAKGTLNWGGVYGHSWFIDPTAGITTVLVTNTVYEGMLGQVTVDLRDAIYGVS